VQHFLTLLKDVIIEALPLLLMGSALASGGSILKLADIGSVRHRGSFWHVLSEATPADLPLHKPCHVSARHIPSNLQLSRYTQNSRLNEQTLSGRNTSSLQN